MNELRHTELDVLDHQLSRSYLDPVIAIPFLSTAYDGFGSAFNIIAALTALELSIELGPVYLVAISVGLAYLLLKVRTTRHNINIHKERAARLEYSIITDYDYQYWSSIIPKLQKEGKIIDMRTFMKSHSAEEIVMELGRYYYRVTEYAQKICSLETSNKDPSITDVLAKKKQKIEALLQNLDLQFAAEWGQFSDTPLTQKLNGVCGKMLVPFDKDQSPSRLTAFWNNLRKYYKSALNGAATAAFLAGFLVASFLTTATLTALFPWSLIALGVVCLGGAYIGYYIDKHTDRRHKNNLKLIEKAQLALQNKRRLGNLLTQTHLVNKEIHQIGEEIELTAKTGHVQNIALPYERKPLPRIRSSLPALQDEYEEVKKLRTQSQIKRYTGDYFLATFLAIRTGLSIVTNIFAGIGLVGLVLPIYPVAVIGIGMAIISIGFHAYNNRMKHLSEFQRLSSLNNQISLTKFQYWEALFNNLGWENTTNYMKQNTTEIILEDVIDEYAEFRQVLKGFASVEHDPAFNDAKKALIKLHGQLILQLRSQANSLNNKEQADKLAKILKLIKQPPAPQLVLIENPFTRVIAQAGRFIMDNYRDALKGFSLGSGIALTTFAFAGISLAATMPYSLLIILAAGALGILVKFVIRYIIKAGRSEHLKTIDTASQSICDKEKLVDSLLAIKQTRKEAEELITHCVPKAPVEVNENPARLPARSAVKPHTARLLPFSGNRFWAHASGTDTEDEVDDFNDVLSENAGAGKGQLSPKLDVRFSIGIRG